MWFTIDPSHYTEVVELLFSYNVLVAINVAEGFIKVMPLDNDTYNFRLCEMAFQMNFKQGGRVCPVCEKNGATTCGHLHFTCPINH